jgi:hypothetical protein
MRLFTRMSFIALIQISSGTEGEINRFEMSYCARIVALVLLLALFDRSSSVSQIATGRYFHIQSSDGLVGKAPFIKYSIVIISNSE